MTSTRELLASIKSELPSRQFHQWSGKIRTINHADDEIPVAIVSPQEFAFLYDNTPPESRNCSFQLSNLGWHNLIFDGIAVIEHVEKPYKEISAQGTNPYYAARRLAWMNFVRVASKGDASITKLKLLKSIFNFSWWLFYKFHPWTLPPTPHTDEFFTRKIYVGDGPMGKNWNGVHLIPKENDEPISRTKRIQ
jgi:hypothetical protein